jgi:hypothetical protein
VSVFLTDLEHAGFDLQLDPQSWSEILRRLSGAEGTAVQALSRWDGTARLEVSKDDARKLAKHLHKVCSDELLIQMKRPEIPSYIVPIATSNGVWIDPALPLLHRRDQEFLSIMRFAAFCLDCSGFSIG